MLIDIHKIRLYRISWAMYDMQGKSTSMPKVGIKVRISRHRQKEKKMPAIDIVAEAFVTSSCCAGFGR